MPYSSTDELPSQTSKLSAKKKRQFMHVVNSALESGDSEESAFKQAWSAVSKDFDSWDVIQRQIDQPTANYSPTAGTPERMCAGCNWFVSPDSCVVVMGIVSPTGVSDLYMAKEEYEPEPIPVTIVKDSTLSLDKPITLIKEEDEDEEEKKKKKRNYMKEFGNTLLHMLGFSGNDFGKEEAAPVQIVKQADGRTRFFIIYSNQFKDREAQILTESAHKEFEGWADNGNYPELWFWHAKGSRIGQVDWVHYHKGLACASGLIDEAAVNIVGRMDLGRLGVSHGFLAAATKEGHVVKYRTYEMSLLPRERAANVWTTVNLFKDVESEDGMAFTDAKRKFLIEQFGDESLVNQMERDTEALAEQLKAAGVEYKEVTEPSLGAEVAQLVSTFKEFAEVMTTQVKELTERVEASEKDADAKFVAAWDSKMAQLPKAFSASADDSTVVAAGTKEPQSLEWLENAMNHSFRGAN